VLKTLWENMPWECEDVIDIESIRENRLPKVWEGGTVNELVRVSNGGSERGGSSQAASQLV